MKNEEFFIFESAQICVISGKLFLPQISQISAEKSEKNLDRNYCKLCGDLRNQREPYPR